MRITKELFAFIPQIDEGNGEIRAYPLQVGTAKVPVGIIPDVAHRPHAVPASIPIAVDAGQCWLSFAAEDPTVTVPETTAGRRESPGSPQSMGKTVDATTERIAEGLRQVLTAQRAERTLGGDRGIAKPLVTSDRHLEPVQKSRIAKRRQQRPRWQRRASRRNQGSRNRHQAYRKATRCQQYPKHVRPDYAPQTSHRLVAKASHDLYVFEDLKIANMTRRPKAKRDAAGRFLRNGARAKAGLNRAILASAWGDVVLCTRYKALLRQGNLVIMVPPA